MGLIDWLIVGVFLVFIVWMGFYTMKYVRGVTDFLACGRVCGRYVLCVEDLANALGVVTLLGYVEAHYKTGYLVGFWGAVTIPIGMFLSLTGFVTYRFRQTKSMSFGQFIEMRYSRRLRIFASTLRAIADMLANMILPALAGRFFIYFLDLPLTFPLFGFQISTFVVVMLICLSLAIFMILAGGSITMVITDTVQGLIAYPVLAIFVFFLLQQFSWNNEIMPVMFDRAPGESFINPYDVENLRDFNLFMVFVGIFTMFLNRGIGAGAGGGGNAAKSPHEQKMAGILGSWRGGFSTILFLLIGVSVIVFMNHRNFAEKATESRRDLSEKIVSEIISDPQIREEIIAKHKAIPPHNHTIGVDAPLSQSKNLDTPYIDTIIETSKAHPDANLQGKVQEFRTIFHQQMLPSVMRKILPPGLMGLFCLLIILMIISTDNGRIFSSSLTLSQDLFLPLIKRPLTPTQHIRMIRWVTVGVGVIFFCGSLFMSQVDFVILFIRIMYGIWAAGAGAVVLGGLYTRFGTAQGAWAALISGSGIMIGGIIIQRSWATVVYPWLDGRNWVDPVGGFLQTVSSPFHPWVVWEMDPHKFPINSIEISFVAMILSVAAYVVVSLLTCREPFNLDRMLHRGKYNIDGFVESNRTWTWKNVLNRLIGITNEYTRGDKLITWSVFLHSFVLGFCVFLIIVTWNLFQRWPDQWWGNYFFIFSLAIPGVLAVVTTIWFFIGGVIDLRQMFRDLEDRTVNVLDDGRVEGNISVADKAVLEEIDKESDGPKNSK